MQRYESYKPTSIEWAPEIPAKWEVQPIRALFNERKERNEGPKTDFILSVMKDIGVIPYDEKGNVGNKKSENIENYKVVYPGDLVVNKMNAIIGSLGISRHHGALSQVYFVLYPKDHSCTNHKYLGYLFRVKPFQQSLIKISKGMMELRESIEFDEFKKLVLPVPPLDEQDRIVAFLDQKIAEIDAAIAKKERLIELIKEQKSVLIKQAVSRGLQLDVAMQDSGIPWFGKVPSHWQVLPIRRIAKTVKTGRTPPSDSKFDGFENGSIFWFSPGDFREDGAFEKSSRLVNQRAIRHGHVEVFAANSIYFIGIGATLGKACVSKIPASCNQQVNVISLLENYDPDFFTYQLNSIRQDIFGLADFTTMPILNQMGTKRIRVAIPPSEEQKEIVGYVKRISEIYESAIDAQQKLISSLREMRSMTIAQTVKGSVQI